MAHIDLDLQLQLCIHHRFHHLTSHTRTHSLESRSSLSHPDRPAGRIESSNQSNRRIAESIESNQSSESKLRAIPRAGAGGRSDAEIHKVNSQSALSSESNRSEIHKNTRDARENQGRPRSGRKAERRRRRSQAQGVGLGYRVRVRE